MTVARLLSSCREHAIDMEARLYPAERLPRRQPNRGAELSNVIHISFPSAGSPAAPDIA